MSNADSQKDLTHRVEILRVAHPELHAYLDELVRFVTEGDGDRRQARVAQRAPRA